MTWTTCQNVLLSLGLTLQRFLIPIMERQFQVRKVITCVNKGKKRTRQQLDI